MAPLLLLVLLGGLCALISIASSSSSRTKKEPESAKKQGSKPEPERERAPEGSDDAGLSVVFSTFDHDGDGFITTAELEESLKRLGIAVSPAEAASMVERVDANRDGLIDIHEFRELYDNIPNKKPRPSEGAAGDSPPEGEEEEEDKHLREAFDVFDGNGDGLISAEELGTVLGSLGLRHGGRAADCRDMIRLVDSDGDGMVSFEEFKRMMVVRA